MEQLLVVDLQQHVRDLAGQVRVHALDQRGQALTQYLKSKTQSAIFNNSEEGDDEEAKKKNGEEAEEEDNSDINS